MKTLSILFFLTILASTFLMGQALLQDDFTGAAGTQLVSAGWTQSGTTSTNPLMITAGSLSIGKYSGSGVGNSATLAVSGQDVYNNFTPTSAGSIYLTFMLNVMTVGTGDYFIALSPSTSQTNYYARLHVKSSGAGYVVGISKSNEVSGGAQYGSTVLSLNTTNLIVVKYTFAPSDSTNDPISVFVFPTSVPTVEPTTPEIPSYVCATKNDATDLGSVTIRQGSSPGSPTLILDGIRVGTSWALSVPTAVDNSIAEAPKSFMLYNNYPNPFNPSTTVNFSVANQGWTTLKVYNFLGQQVASAFEGNAEPNTSYSVKIDGAKLASGTYFYTLQSGSERMIKKMLLMK